MRQLLVFLIILISSTAAAQSLPENGHPNPFGGGWSCNYGFRRSGEKCTKVVVPPNAEIDFTGAAWKCSHGFRSSGDGCERVVVPPNAEIDFTGAAWKCSYGFRRSGDRCERVVVPPNAEIDFTGAAWKCSHGFRRVGDNCERVNLPKNAELDFTGGNWQCAKGFKRAGDQCEKIVIPPNAELNIAGSDWTCSKGYRRSGDACARMTSDELALEAERQRKFAEYMRQRRARFANSENCEREYKTNANVCIKITNIDISCSKNSDENTYRSCDVPISYEITTDYAGGSSMEVEIKCEAEIRYTSAGYSKLNSDYKKDSHILSSNSSDSETADLNFSFSSYQEVTSVKVIDSKCEIEEVSLQ